MTRTRLQPLACFFFTDIEDISRTLHMTLPSMQLNPLNNRVILALNSVQDPPVSLDVVPVAGSFQSLLHHRLSRLPENALNRSIAGLTVDWMNMVGPAYNDILLVESSLFRLHDVLTAATEDRWFHDAIFSW